MTDKSNYSLSFGIGTLVGVLAGVALGLLFTPKPGEEMRKDLANAIENVVKEKKPIKILEAKKISAISFARLQYAIESQFTKIINAIKADKMAAAKRREELESLYKY